MKNAMTRQSFHAWRVQCVLKPDFNPVHGIKKNGNASKHWCFLSVTNHAQADDKELLNKELLNMTRD